VADFFLKWWAGAYSNPTDAERSLEPAVAALGLPYRFQHPIWALRYRLDFAIPSLKLAIEVDDPSHTGKKKRAADKMRTARLKKAGWTVVRCTNAEALEDPHGAMTRMLKDAGVPHPNKD
jgi:very-short-patch-repair endonuclease